MPFHPDIVVANDDEKTYELVYADTATGCRAADTTTIRVKGTPNVSILTSPDSDSAICKSQDRLLFELTPSPEFLPPTDSISLTGAPGITASIGNSGGFLDIKNNSGILEQTYTIQYYYRTSEGCSNTSSKTIRVQYPPDVELSKNGSACEYGGSFSINVLKSPSAKHPYNLLWSVVNGTGKIESQDNNQLVYTPSEAEKASGKVNIAIITTNNGLCAAASDTSVFTINPKPVAIFSGVDSGCVKSGFPLTINLQAGPNPVAGCNYVWKVNNSVEIDSLNKTSFTKVLTTANSYPMQLIVYNAATGCVDTSSIQTSTAWLTPTADFEPNKYATTIAKPYFDFNNKSTPDLASNQYLWRLGIDPQTNLPRTSPLKDLRDVNFIADTAQIPITLLVMSEKGCVDSITKYIKIEPDITVFIPNVFYPKSKNNPNSGASDGPCNIGGIPCNQHFFVQAAGFESIEIYVYNRWGKLVFQTNNINEGWDGTDLKTKAECQQDAYVYQIFATSFGGKKYEYAGSVTLLR
jgi:gliding motility-associated-like protein